MERHMIWSNRNISVDDFKMGLEDDDPLLALSEADLWEYAYEANSEWLECERANLNIQLDTAIVVIGNLGFWNGKRCGYKMIDSGNIKDCLYTSDDYAEYFVEGGELCAYTTNHDASSSLIYRKLKSNITDKQLDKLQESILKSIQGNPLIDKYTEKLGDVVGKVYGWPTLHEELKARKVYDKAIYKGRIIRALRPLNEFLEQNVTPVNFELVSTDKYIELRSTNKKVSVKFKAYGNKTIRLMSVHGLDISLKDQLQKVLFDTITNLSGVGLAIHSVEFVVLNKGYFDNQLICNIEPNGFESGEYNAKVVRGK